MASVTKNDEKTMATDVTASSSGDPDKPTPPQRLAPPSEGGFFHIVKRGQGYWTRMGTAGVAVMLIALVGVNTALIMEGQFKISRSVSVGTAVGVSIAL